MFELEEMLLEEGLWLPVPKTNDRPKMNHIRILNAKVGDDCLFQTVYNSYRNCVSCFNKEDWSDYQFQFSYDFVRFHYGPNSGILHVTFYAR